ncbi:conserved hypothetical protein [Thioalkalivibrio sulfidiphilus HL-EbGr7]|uniref:DUF4399 domain-containing protein n=1 Tax=Thioalkalivibrio sulfidiphilus (strain HL-EbGR7) TaxID=396588 RepID=B8GU96_THISH|nr:conserved hypothetical protein [Thioalkalivibrio sulfidiphilus HL-EbGr7]
MKRYLAFVLIPILSLLLLTTAQAELKRVAPPEGASVYLISPADGETIRGPVTVRMGLRGMGVAPAGIDHPNTGHHHLLVNMPLEQVDLSASLPFSDQTRHFGGGQTEARLELQPGTYTLQLLFMDYRHVSFDPPVVSEVVTITVE